MAQFLLIVFLLAGATFNIYLFIQALKQGCTPGLFSKFGDYVYFRVREPIRFWLAMLLQLGVVCFSLWLGLMLIRGWIWHTPVFYPIRFR